MHADELRDATRERLLAEIGALRHQYDISNQAQLVGRIRELEMALLQSRDYSMGLSAEVGELRAQLKNEAQRVKAETQRVRRQMMQTPTFRVGALVLLPLRLVKRLFRKK
jgi:hypothetical protein